MKKILTSAVVAVIAFSGSLLAFEPAVAITPADVVSSSATTITADCHGGQTANVYSNYALFTDDTFTLSLTNCNAHFANTNRWNYGNVYTKVNGGNGGSGVRDPNTFALGLDQQCLQQNVTLPGSWTGLPYGFTGITATMAANVTNSSDVEANNPYYIFVYDHDAGSCSTGNFWRFKQLVYTLYQVTPTVTAEFADATVSVNTDSTLTVTLTNTQRYRTGVRESFTGLNLDIALPADANMDTASAAGTCGGTLTATTPGGVPTLHYVGGSLDNTTDFCTITVPVAFAASGAKDLTASSLTSSASNKSALINDLSASINVLGAQYIEPEQQSPVLQAMTPMTPTDAFTPTGFTGTVTYSIEPTIPDGLSFDASTGIVSGTPTTPGASADYTVTATDGTFTATAIITMGVAARPAGLYPAVQTTEARVGEAMTPTDEIDVSALPCPAFLTISPALPDGLVFDDETGVISGTPTTPSAEAVYSISSDCGEGGLYTATVNLSVGAGGPDIGGLVNTGLAFLGPAGVIGVLLAVGAPFFFVSERFRQVRTAGAVVLHRSAHLTITSPARFFDRLRRKQQNLR